MAKAITELENENLQLKQEILDLQKNDFYFRSIFKQVAVGIAIVSKDGSWLKVNNKICDIFGYSSDELINTPVKNIIHVDNKIEDVRLLDDFFLGKTKNIWQIYSYKNRYDIKGWMYVRISEHNELEFEDSYVCIIDDITELKSVQQNVETLKGLLPICASCKKIKNDGGYWDQIETYIQKHSEAEFSHSLCPACTEDLYGKEEWYIRRKQKNNPEVID